MSLCYQHVSVSVHGISGYWFRILHSPARWVACNQYARCSSSLSSWPSKCRLLCKDLCWGLGCRSCYLLSVEKYLSSLLCWSLVINTGSCTCWFENYELRYILIYFMEIYILFNWGYYLVLDLHYFGNYFSNDDDINVY